MFLVGDELPTKACQVVKNCAFCTFLIIIAKFITRFLLRSSKIEPDQNSYIWE